MAAAPTIFISAWRNPSVRYLLYSDVFQVLKDSGARLVVFLRDEDLEHFAPRLEGGNVLCRPVLMPQALAQLKGTRLGRWLLLANTRLSGGDGRQRNLTAEARTYLHDYNFHGGRRAQAVDNAAIALGRLAGQSPALRRGLIALQDRLFPGRFYDPYFREFQPRLLVTSSVGYSIDPFFMRAARRHHCPVAAVVHSWDNPTAKGYRAARPDAVIAWNLRMAQELAVYQDIDPGIISVEGVAHWDYYFDGSLRLRPRPEFLASLGLDPGRRLLFYGSSAPKNFPHTFDALEWLAQAIREDRFAQPAQLLVRLHPAYFVSKGNGQVLESYQGRIEALERDYRGLVRFAHPRIESLSGGLDMPKEDMLGLAETLGHADVLLTEYSTLMIEAAILDRPVINVSLFQYRDTDRPARFFETYTHLQPVLESGACRNAYSFGELEALLNGYLRDPSLDRENRARLVDKMIPVNRGRAGQAVGRRLLHLAGLAEKV
ncbi:MAG: hypothetical protein C4525_07865 [Desulfarculus sp.]|nr:MAG: hypothetical protein C4525_07865 [Desulfarculus sp.]